MTATSAGPEFDKAMRPILKERERCLMADFSRLQAPAAIPADAKNSTLAKIKCVCDTCGYCLYHAKMVWLGRFTALSEALPSECH
jgi:hypothetical protein